VAEFLTATTFTPDDNPPPPDTDVDPLDAAYRLAQLATDDPANGHHDQTTRFIIRWCRELQAASPGTPFALSSRAIAERMCIDHSVASGRLRALCGRGIIRVVAAGCRNRSARYRFITEE
jgi:hypothetical protein